MSKRVSSLLIFGASCLFIFTQCAKDDTECDPGVVGSECWVCSNTDPGLPACLDCDPTNPAHVTCYVPPACNNLAAGGTPCADCDSNNIAHLACYVAPVCNNLVAGTPCADCDSANPAHLACYVPLPDHFRFFNPDNRADIPESLSKSGLYKGKVIDPNAIPYDVIIPQWSDSVSSLRYIILDQGKQITFNSNDDLYGYPDSGVAWVRTLYIDTIFGDINSRVFWETRLLIKQGGTYHALNYRWNKEQTDAYRIKDLIPKDTTFTILKGGVPEIHKWRHQDRLSCATCHKEGRKVAGFYTANLNRVSVPEPAKNQIQYLFERGIFTGAAPGGYDLMPRFIWEPYSTDNTVRHKSIRSYLGGQCSLCHGSKSHDIEARAMNFDFFNGQNGLDSLVDGFTGSLISRCFDSKLISSGEPGASTLYSRVSMRTSSMGTFVPVTGQMPPTMTFLPDTAALNLLSDWICDLDTTWCKVTVGSQKIQTLDTAIIIPDSIWNDQSTTYTYFGDQVRPDTIIIPTANPLVLDTILLDSITSHTEKCKEIVPIFPK